MTQSISDRLRTKTSFLLDGMKVLTASWTWSMSSLTLFTGKGKFTKSEVGLTKINSITFISSLLMIEFFKLEYLIYYINLK